MVVGFTLRPNGCLHATGLRFSVSASHLAQTGVTARRNAIGVSSILITHGSPVVGLNNYVELRCTEYAWGEKTIVYSFDLYSLLKSLWEHQLADVHDPQGLLGRVPAWPAGADKETALSRLRSALYHAERAQETAARGETEEAFRYWNGVFNGHFPAYE